MGWNRKAAAKKGRVVIALPGVVALVVIAFVLWPREREPECKGKKLSELLLIYESWENASLSSSGEEFRKAWATMDEAWNARETIEGMGTNALPCLLRWVSYEPSRWNKWATRVSTNLPEVIRRTRVCSWAIDDTANHHRASLAMEGFLILDEHASPAVPELSRLKAETKDREAAFRMSRVLYALGVTNAMKEYLE